MAHFEFFLTDSLEKVFADSRPRPMTKKHLTVLQGERFSFQLVYRLSSPEPDAAPQYFQISVEGAPSEVRIRSVELIPSQYPCTPKRDNNYLRTAPGLFPDLLLPSGGRIMPVNEQFRSLWIDFTIPANAKGNYTLSIKADAEKESSFGSGTARKNLTAENWQDTIYLEVVPAEAGKQQLIHTEWFHADCLADYYGVEPLSEEHWRITENFIRFAAEEGGINTLLTPVYTPPLDTEAGGERTTVQLVAIQKEGEHYRFNFSALRRWCGICRSCGIEYLEIAHLFTQWGARSTPKIMAEVNGKETMLFGWHVPATSPEYRAFLEAFIPALTQVLSEEGYGKEAVYFHISDEPREKDKDSYLAAKNQVKDLLEGYKIMDALSSFKLYRDAVVEHPITANDHIQEFIDAKVENLWVYYCVSQGRDVPNRFFALPSARNRIMGILMYIYRIQGFLHWGYNFYNSSFSRKHINPFITTDCEMAFPSGDPFLVYPAPEGVPYSSIRNQVQMEALQDLKALKLLEKLTSRETVIRLIMREREKPFTFTDYPGNPEFITGLRERVNKRIAEALKN